MPSSLLTPNNFPKTHSHVVIRSSQQIPAWRGVTLTEGSDNGGIVYNSSSNTHRVFILLDGEVETWWNSGGFGRWRRALPDAISVSSRGPSDNSSWANHRHYAYATLTPDYLSSLLDGESLRRITAMPPHYCLQEYYDRAAEGVALVRSLHHLLHAPTAEIGLQSEELSLALVRWLEGVAGCRPAPDPADGLNRAQLRRVIDLVDASLNKPLSLQNLADLAGVSPFHFCKMFKRTTGVSPWQFVIRWRIDRAALMLIHQRSATLSAIATACGFVDQSHLTRVFKRLRGLTPGEFARRYAR